VGVAVNAFATRLVASADRDNMAVEGSFQHLLTDLYAFAATAVAGGVILATSFERADPIASLFVAALMLRAAYGLLKQSGRVLLEAAPERLSVADIARTIGNHEQVVSLHDLHVWEVGSGFPALSAHVLVAQGADCHGIRRELEAVLHDRFGIDHTTLQVEHAQPELLHIRSSR
jgi:cobalt-zinc-cadmium efflux system protein